MVSGGKFTNCVCTGISTLLVDFDSSNATQKTDGIIDNVAVSMAITLANVDTLFDGGYAPTRVYVSQLGSESGAKVPVATAD
jgi:hypothetical protein